MTRYSRKGQDRDNLPDQFTSEEGAGSDLYACQSNEAVFARLLDHTSGDFVANDFCYLTKPGER